MATTAEPGSTTNSQGTAGPTTAKGSAGVAPVWTPDGEVKALRSIAGEAADPAHLYGTDEDAGFGGLGLDPTVSRYDQTDDPLGGAG